MSGIKVGVVGAGWAGQQHLKGYDALDDVEIAGLAGMETELVAQLQGEYGIPATFERWEDMLDSLELDAISIATPTFLHAPIAIAALERGIHVLTEKPIAADIEDARRMVEAARTSGRVLQVVFNHRLRGDIAELGRIIDSGQLGTPYIAKAGWLRRAGIPGSSWFAQKQLSGGGPLLDLGVHVVDYVLHLLGEPEVATVSASTYAELGAKAVEGFDVEDIAIAFVRLTNGATVTLEASWDAYRADNNLYWMTVYGTDGGAELRVTDYETSEFTVFRNEDGANADYTATPGENGGHDRVVREFVEAIAAGASEWAKHDGSLGLKRAEVIDACYRSAESGHEVALA
ncbi:Gfo/Idh/MocA family oxidoreductase [Planctomonas sp. JC2975]|uniref:Gfo/Idh/MocA family protein n=1 Tax=Planctomonas sp. JC2975 TaxID=2729626 RepID=UPI001474E517|nr:Gfo/Idh/MocA family oxidoreductase [Planctomonas sp. JC2975]NNC13497.1 Gfo/Idh/MocA family oxidoreductase [Planctomonas sp. JC2975]